MQKGKEGTTSAASLFMEVLKPVNRKRYDGDIHIHQIDSIKTTRLFVTKIVAPLEKRQGFYAEQKHGEILRTTSNLTSQEIMELVGAFKPTDPDEVYANLMFFIDQFGKDAGSYFEATNQRSCEIILGFVWAETDNEEDYLPIAKIYRDGQILCDMRTFGRHPIGTLIFQ